jgi:hypothetical protein
MESFICRNIDLKKTKTVEMWKRHRFRSGKTQMAKVDGIVLDVAMMEEVRYRRCGYRWTFHRARSYCANQISRKKKKRGSIT